MPARSTRIIYGENPGATQMPHRARARQTTERFLPVTLAALERRSRMPMLRLINPPPVLTMPSFIRTRNLRAAALATGAASLLAGCATPTLDAQWRSVELPAHYLRGTTVLVSCEAREVVLQRICEERLTAELSAHGATPVLPAPGTVAAVQPGVADLQYLPAAHGLGAAAVFSVTLGLSSQSVSPGFSIGIGGFGFGGHSAGGIGVSAPIGGGRVSSGYSANGRITDVASGRLMWTARASTPPSSDVGAQLADLSKTLLGAADRAGLF